MIYTLQTYQGYSTLKRRETTVSTSFQRGIHVVSLQGSLEAHGGSVARTPAFFLRRENYFTDNVVVYLLTLCRSSHPEVFYNRAVLKNIETFSGKLLR